jgi:DNA-binding CsgD family transcriptional regulator
MIMTQSDLTNVFRMKAQEARAKLEKLTPREMEVAEQLAMGISNMNIAEGFRISRKTVDIHRGNIKRKLETTIHGIGRIWFLAKLAEKKG